MHFITVVLTIMDTEFVHPCPDNVREALLLQAVADDRVEHVRVRALAGELRIGVLTLAEPVDDAAHRVQMLAGKACAAGGVLAGWSIR